MCPLDALSGEHTWPASLEYVWSLSTVTFVSVLHQVGKHLKSLFGL